MSEQAWITEAKRHIGTREIPGARHEPKILAWWKAIKRGGIKSDEVLVFLEWLGYSIFWRHAIFGKSLVNGFSVYAKTFLSRFKSELFAKSRELERVALIIALIFTRGPSAIFERVSKIIVDSVERVVVTWPRPHILKKALESSFNTISNKPAIANGNATPAISTVPTAFLVVAASLHVTPNPLLCLVRSAMLRVGFFCSRWHSSLTNAAAVSGFSASEVISIHKLGGSAFTAARSFTSNRFPGDSPFAKSFHNLT